MTFRECIDNALDITEFLSERGLSLQRLLQESRVSEAEFEHWQHGEIDQRYYETCEKLERGMGHLEHEGRFLARAYEMAYKNDFEISKTLIHPFVK